MLAWSRGEVPSSKLAELRDGLSDNNSRGPGQ
jgi:hypothetical protein